MPGRMRRCYDRIRAHLSRGLLWTAAAGLGLCVGGGGYTFVYAKGLSYISNDPEVCANCHVMQSYYDGWVTSSHHAVAVCNDCHTPHHFIGKYMTKAENGLHHSTAFTLQNYPDSIRIRPKNARIVGRNCLRCHDDMVSGILGHGGREGDDPDCVRCHAGVGHELE